MRYELPFKMKNDIMNDRIGNKNDEIFSQRRKQEMGHPVRGSKEELSFDFQTVNCLESCALCFQYSLMWYILRLIRLGSYISGRCKPATKSKLCRIFPQAYSHTAQNLTFFKSCSNLKKKILFSLFTNLGLVWKCWRGWGKYRTEQVPWAILWT